MSTLLRLDCDEDEPQRSEDDSENELTRHAHDPPTISTAIFEFNLSQSTCSPLPLTVTLSSQG
jgi:hypothetical protein